MVDESSNSMGVGIRICILGLGKFKAHHSFRLDFNALNNVAEYEALISGFQIVNLLDARMIEIFSDSQLIVKQMIGEFDVSDAELH